MTMPEHGPGFTIRTARVADIPKIVQLARDMVVHSLSSLRRISVDEVKIFRERDLAGLEAAWRHGNVQVFVAESDQGEFIGHCMLMLGMMESSTGESQAWIFDLAVSDEYQRRGVGRALTLAAEDYATSRGEKYIGLAVTSDNLPAVAFYQDMGYREERKRMLKRLGEETGMKG